MGPIEATRLGAPGPDPWSAPDWGGLGVPGGLPGGLCPGFNNKDKTPESRAGALRLRTIGRHFYCTSHVTGAMRGGGGFCPPPPRTLARGFFCPYLLLFD